ncbi:hypothetical protein [Actinoplanes sp. NPDC049802]|uniref:hypothetical protein n=1 Tax=Actinoplanes sp. NPDC049802 TaxID=3154742 RepID=UPI0033EA78C2
MVLADPPQDPPAPPGGGNRHAWPAVVIAVLVLAGVLAMLLTGHPLEEALMLGGGVTLLGVTLARRVLAGAGPMPTVVLAAAVAVFAGVLVIRGYLVADVAVACGLTGLVAGEIVGRYL